MMTTQYRIEYIKNPTKKVLLKIHQKKVCISYEFEIFIFEIEWIILFSLIKGEKNPTSKPKLAGKNKRSISSERYIEALVVADYSIVNHFKNLNQSLETYLLTILNMVN